MDHNSGKVAALGLEPQESYWITAWKKGTGVLFSWEGKIFLLFVGLNLMVLTFLPGSGGWKTNQEGFLNLVKAGRILRRDKSLSYVRYLGDFPVVPITNLCLDTRWGFDASERIYVVQTNVKTVQRCLLMNTDPGDLVLDPTCGSGTTAYVAEQLGRRWISPHQVNS